MNCWINGWRLVLFPTTRFTKPKTQTEITLSANIRPKSWLNAANQLFYDSECW